MSDVSRFASGCRVEKGLEVSEAGRAVGRFLQAVAVGVDPRRQV